MPRATLLLLLCPALLAQTQPAPDPSTLASIEGRIIDAVTGQPLRKTQLSLHGGAGGEYASTSDASGHFAITKIAPGPYTLTAQHQNYSVVDYGAARPGTPGTRLTLTAGQSMTSIEIKMVPFGVISGKVVDQDGDPVTGVPIVVLRWGFVRGGRQLLPSGGGGSTNDRGEYRIYNLPSGRYLLAARPVRSDMYSSLADSAAGRRTAPRVEAPRESFVQTFYPSSPDPATASAVVVNAGQEVLGMDIQLRKTRTYIVQGKLAGIQTGRRYSLMLQPQDSSSNSNMGTGRAAAVRPEDATFTFRGVTPGRYTLVAIADNRVNARQEIAIGDGDLEGLTVPITEPGAIKGTVRMEPSGVAKLPPLKGLRISLTPVNGVLMNVPNAGTGEDGSFVIEDVAADRYKVGCSPLQGAYLKSIRWSGQVSNNGIVEMVPGGTAALELVFAASSAAIEGDVKTADDKPAPGTPVLLIPASHRETDFRLTMTDQNGHFSAKGVAPGGYIALATDASIFSMPDPAFLKAIEKLATSLNVDENGQATVSLKLVPEATLEAAQ